MHKKQHSNMEYKSGIPCFNLDCPNTWLRCSKLYLPLWTLSTMITKYTVHQLAIPQSVFLGLFPQGSFPVYLSPVSISSWPPPHSSCTHCPRSGVEAGSVPTCSWEETGKEGTAFTGNKAASNPGPKTYSTDNGIY